MEEKLIFSSFLFSLVCVCISTALCTVVCGEEIKQLILEEEKMLPEKKE